MMLFDEIDSRHVILLLLLLAAVIIVGVAVAGLWFDKIATGKCLQTASGLFGLASAYQLKLSGWFDKAFLEYSDEKKYPFGPPSEFVRQIIDHPDFPLQSAIRSFLFFDPNMGGLLASISILVAMIAAWL